MKARAPGKVVVSGAYAVLEGAPALVAAVDRYVEADSARPASFVTPEVRAALGDAGAIWFDASSLRDGDSKLGLGSSAAILVATLAARRGETDPIATDAELAEAVFEPARAAHRAAQGGGSGIDVAASAFGGFLITQIRGESLVRRAVSLSGVHLEVWAAGAPASTAGLLRIVRAFRQRDPAEYGRLLRALSDAALLAEQAIDGGKPSRFVEALGLQRAGLGALGAASGAPIVTPEVETLARAATEEGAAVLPAGAGGGDIVLFAGLAPPSAALRDAAERHGHARLNLRLGARGVHLCPTKPATPRPPRV